MKSRAAGEGEPAGAGPESQGGRLAWLTRADGPCRLRSLPLLALTVSPALCSLWEGLGLGTRGGVRRQPRSRDLVIHTLPCSPPRSQGFPSRESQAQSSLTLGRSLSPSVLLPERE